MKKMINLVGVLFLGLALAGCPAEKTATDDSKASAPAAKTADKGADVDGAKKPEKAPASKPGDAAASAPALDPAKAPAQSVHFVWPEEGSKVFEAFHVVFGLSGKTISQAGKDIDDKSKGHHHLIIDSGPIKEGATIPSDDKHIHFGKGQTETDVTLPPGKHSLTMQFADGAHRSYGPKMSKTINIEVVPPKEARQVFFVGLKDGAKVKSPVKLKFGLKGYTIRPAGQSTSDKTSGHHHVIVDAKPVPFGQVVPADEQHIHFGKGQTEAEIKLSAGKHTLTLQLADGAHRSYGANLSNTVTVEVE